MLGCSEGVGQGDWGMSSCILVRAGARDHAKQHHLQGGPPQGGRARPRPIDHRDHNVSRGTRRPASTGDPPWPRTASSHVHLQAQPIEPTRNNGSCAHGLYDGCAACSQVIPSARFYLLGPGQQYSPSFIRIFYNATAGSKSVSAKLRRTRGATASLAPALRSLCTV